MHLFPSAQTLIFSALYSPTMYINNIEKISDFYYYSCRHKCMLKF